MNGPPRRPARAPGRAPGDPESRVGKTNAALRILGLGILFLALITGTKSLTSGTKSVADRPAIVLADESLRAVLPSVTPKAQYRYGAPQELAAKVAAGSDADLLISSDGPALTALAKDDRCTGAVTFATRGGAGDDPATTPATSPTATTGLTTYAYCVIIRGGANEAVAAEYIQGLTGIAGREALLDAGYEVPPTR